MTIELPRATRARLLRTRRWVLAGTASRHQRKVISSVTVYYGAVRGYRLIRDLPVVGTFARNGVNLVRRASRTVRGPR